MQIIGIIIVALGIGLTGCGRNWPFAFSRYLSTDVGSDQGSYYGDQPDFAGNGLLLWPLRPWDQPAEYWLSSSSSL